MTEWISEADFAAAEGVEGWRPLFWGAKTIFDTGDFTTGARLVALIAEQADAVGHAPIVELRIDTVTVQVFTIAVGGLSDLDLELARRISAAAAELGLVADPAVQQLEIAIDVADPEAVMSFWSAALGYVQVSPEVMVEPNLSGPAFSFHRKEHVPPRNRIHVDVSMPHDRAQERIEAALAAGGRLLGDKYAPAWWSLIDAEGNVVDIATWQGRDDLPD